MVFHAFRNFADYGIPGRAYVHSAGLRESYDGAPENAIKYFEDKVWHNLILPTPNKLRVPSNSLFFLAALWGDSKTGDKMADLFLYGQRSDNWKSNLTVAAATVRNGVECTVNGLIGCEEVMTMLGREAELRRGTKDVIDYLNVSDPQIPSHLWAPINCRLPEQGMLFVPSNTPESAQPARAIVSAPTSPDAPEGEEEKDIPF